MPGIRHLLNGSPVTPSPPVGGGPSILTNAQLTAEVANLVASLDDVAAGIPAIQAGTVSASSSSGTVVFPVAFSSAPVVTVSPRYTGSGGPYSTPTVNSVTATGFTWGNMVTRRHSMSGGNLQDSAEALGVSPGLTWIAKGN